MGLNRIILNNLNEYEELETNSFKSFKHVNDVWDYLESATSEDDLNEKIKDVDPRKFGSISYDLHKDGNGATVIIDYTSDNEDYYEKVDVYFEEDINEDNFSIDDKIDSIEIYGEDYQFSDTLEELGYEYCLKLFDDMTGNNNLLIYKEVSGNEDFFVIDTTSTGGTLYKVDHNGERLFLSENEAEVLSKRFNRD